MRRCPRRCLKRGERKEKEGESAKEKHGEKEGKDERKEGRVIRVARWPCGRPAKSSFCYDLEIRSCETTCIRDGASRDDLTPRADLSETPISIVVRSLIHRATRIERWRSRSSKLSSKPSSKPSLKPSLKSSKSSFPYARNYGSQQVTSMKGNERESRRSRIEKVDIISTNSNEPYENGPRLFTTANAGCILARIFRGVEYWTEILSGHLKFFLNPIWTTCGIQISRACVKSLLFSLAVVRYLA